VGGIEADVAKHIDFADMIAWAVLDGRQLFGIGARAHAIAIGRHGQADGFMGLIELVSPDLRFLAIGPVRRKPIGFCCPPVAA
jgi:hypothetical protein